MASKTGTKQAVAAADQEFDPKFEWQDNAANYVLRLHLSGFRKEDFRVQVDGAGRLTVRGQRGGDGGKQVRFHKVFQLPPTSNLDGISGRFDAGVLTLTVPKRPAPAAPEETTMKPAKPADEATTKPPLPKEEAESKAPPKKTAESKAPPKNTAESKAPPQAQERKDEAKKAEQQHKLQEEETSKPPKETKAEQQRKELETQKPKGEQTKAEVEAKRSKPEQEPKAAVRKEEDKPPAKAETKPPQAEVVDRDSLLERVKRRAEEERAKAAAAAAEAAERQRKQSACGGWKERVAEELQGLATSEWAEGVVDTVKKNKEVIAAAVTAFSLGLFVSRLFSRN